MLPYRSRTWRKRNTLIQLSKYPSSADVAIHKHNQRFQGERINVHTNLSYRQEDDGKEGWICGRGVAIKTNKDNQLRCFCPPSLYGQFCQYYSDRISAIVALRNIPPYLLDQRSNMIKILVLLLSNDDVIDHHVFHLPLVIFRSVGQKFRFNLIHRRPKHSATMYSVRFEAYYLTSDASIKFLAVWHYPVQFPFLPSYRLAQILGFPKGLLSMTSQHICASVNPCLHGSTCHSVMNAINNISVYYCQCKTYSFGRRCEHLLQPAIPSACSKQALQRPLSSSQTICLCPSHLYGPTCHLSRTCVNKNPCGMSRGKCYVNPDNVERDYICVCDKKFFGDHCQFDSAVVRINFNELTFVQTPSNFILSSIIQLCDLHQETIDLIIRDKRVYQGLPPSNTEIYHSDHYLPMLGMIKLYHKQDSSNDYVANLRRPDYFVFYVAPVNVPDINLTSSINVTNYCPYTPFAFQRNISDVSYLSERKIRCNRFP